MLIKPNARGGAIAGNETEGETKAPTTSTATSWSRTEVGRPSDHPPSTAGLCARAVRGKAGEEGSHCGLWRLY